MSLEFSQELDTPIISPSYAPQDAGEIGLRPKLLGDYTGQEKAKGTLPSTLRLPAAGTNPWTTPCCTALPAWAKPPWQVSLPTKWV